MTSLSFNLRFDNNLLNYLLKYIIMPFYESIELLNKYLKESFLRNIIQ